MTGHGPAPLRSDDGQDLCQLSVQRLEISDQRRAPVAEVHARLCHHRLEGQHHIAHGQRVQPEVRIGSRLRMVGLAVVVDPAGLVRLSVGR